MKVGLDTLPADVLALVFGHLSRVDPICALDMPLVCRKFREACAYAPASFQLSNHRRTTDDVTWLHRRIAVAFPRTRALASSMACGNGPAAERSVEAMAFVLRKCRQLRMLILRNDLRHDSCFSIDSIPWQGPFVDAIRAGIPSKLTHLELSLSTRPNTESSTAELIRLVGARLKTFIGVDLWLDQEGLAAISEGMPKLKSICIDSSNLMLDMPDPNGLGALLADVLAATRWHTARARLPTPRLEQFVARWGPEFWYNDCRLLDWAVASENVDFVRTLLAHGASPHMAFSWSASSPILAAVKSRNVEIARLLLEHGASPEETPECAGERPLHVAVRAVDHAMISLLFEYGVDPHSTTDAGLSAVAIASKHGFLAVLNLLHVLGAPMNNACADTPQPLEVACEANEAFCVARLLMGGARIESSMPGAPCPLFDAVLHGRIAVVEALLYGGGNANVIFDGVSALCVAISRDDLCLVMRLVASGADVNTNSLEGRDTGFMSSPLHHAVNVRSFQVAEYLLAHDADPDAIAGDGTSVLLRARRTNQTAIVGLLLEHNADTRLGDVVTKEPALIGACRV
jgi:ankyrin repeat protein